MSYWVPEEPFRTAIPSSTQFNELQKTVLGISQAMCICTVYLNAAVK